IENRAWCGLLTENVVQACARDLLVASMHRLETAGYPIIMHVHDETVAEGPIGTGSSEEFARIMSEVPSWAEGLPVAVKAHNGLRFVEISEAWEIVPSRPQLEPRITVRDLLEEEPKAKTNSADGSEHRPNGKEWGDYHSGDDARGEDAFYVYTDPAGRPYQG